ncbi:MAG: peptidylprolyl isomerase [Elusimicrobia bacterium]|nr:peptidylprolyl isomerase [Elusimicrobiota bacterium]
MNSSGSRAVLWAAAAAALLAGSVHAKLMEDAVATVNGIPVLLSDFQRELKTSLELFERGQPAAALGPAAQVAERLKGMRESVLDRLIEAELLYQQGDKLKLKVRERDIDQAIEEVKSRITHDETGKKLTEPEVDEVFKKQLKLDGITFAQYRERLVRQVMIRKVVDSEVRPKVTPPGEGEISAYFDKAKAFILSGGTVPPKGMDEEAGLIFMDVAEEIRMRSSERVRVSRILVRFSETASPQEKKRAKAAALEVKKRIDEGKSTFAEIARAESEDPESAANGGDVGFIFKGRTHPDIEKVAFSMSVGDVTAPIETPVGYHILRIVEKRASETPVFADFKEDLGRFLMNVHFSEELGKFMKGVKAKAVIERKLPVN